MTQVKPGGLSACYRAAGWRRGRLPATAVAVAAAVALGLLISPAVERAEHRSGTGGEEAHVSERSELCAVPPAREERRGPMRRSRIGSRPGCAFFWLLFFAQAKRRFFNSRMAGQSDSLLRSRSESSAFRLLFLAATFPPSGKQGSSKSKGFRSPIGERVTSLCSCKEKVTKRSAFQQPNGWSSTPCLRASGPLRRRDFSTRRPCRVEKRRAHPLCG